MAETADLTAFIPEVRFEKIPIKNLVSNQTYQRNLSLSHIQRTAANFNVYQINPVKVSRRGGVNYVFNGQHTIEIVAAVSGSRETPVWCMVYEDMEYAEEAGIFANQQKFVKPLNPYEIFTANIEAGNDQQIIIKQLVESYGLQVSCNRGPNRICAVSTIEFICERYGLNALDRTLRLCVGTWEGESDSLSSAIIKGISLLITAYGGALRDDQFIERVGKFSPREVSRNARERKMGTMGYAEVMLSAYNKKTKYPLPWSRLHSLRSQGSESDDSGIDK